MTASVKKPKKFQRKKANAAGKSEKSGRKGWSNH